MNRISLLALALTLLISACQPAIAPIPTLSPLPTVSPSPTPLPCPQRPPVTDGITVYPGCFLQTIQDVGGGNFIQETALIPESHDPVSDFNRAGLNPKFVRVRMSLEDWEPANDNGDPAQAEMAAFVDDGYVHATFEMMKEMSAQGIEVTATVWDVPDWMVVNPEAEKSRVMAPALYPELIESMTTWLETARAKYGVEVKSVSINEPALGAYVLVPPLQAVEIIRQGGARFAEAGLPAKWLIADAHNIQATLGYAETVLGAPDIRPFLGPLAFHSWDADAPDEALLKIRHFGLENNLEIRCTEGGWKAFYWYTPEQFPSWENGLNLARIYSRVLKLSGASVLQYWQMFGGDYAINDGESGFHAFKILQELTRQFPAGTRVVETSSDTKTVYSAAGQVEGRFVLMVTHTGVETARVMVSGLPAGEYSHLQYTETGRTEQPVTVTDGFSLELPALSVNFLVKNINR